MKVKLFGANCKWCQLPLIQKGFSELYDWELVVNEAADLIYSNDAGYYSQAIEYKEKFGGKLVLNLLDVPVAHIGLDYDLEKVKSQLVRADAITCISKTVQKQIKDFFDLESTVIYNPMKEVFEVPEIYKKNVFLKFLMLGRVNDKNKDFGLVYDLMQKYYDENHLLVVGPEDPVFGKYAGIVDDKYLISYYNHSDIVLQPSYFEGLGLTVIEALVCGKFVITCNDNPAALEFSPEFCCDRNIESIQHKILDFQVRDEYYKNIIKGYQEKYSEQFHYSKIVENIIEVYNNYETSMQRT